MRATSMETIFFFTEKSKGLQMLTLSPSQQCFLSKLATLSKQEKTIDHKTLDRKNNNLYNWPWGSFQAHLRLTLGYFSLTHWNSLHYFIAYNLSASLGENSTSLQVDWRPLRGLSPRPFLYFSPWLRYGFSAHLVGFLSNIPFVMILIL